MTTSIDELDGSCADGDCSLRDALALAASGDSIQFAAGLTGQTINVGSKLVVNKSLAIGSAGQVTISGGGKTPVFDVQSGTVTLSHLTISGGRGVGGGIKNAANLALDYCTLTGNTVTGASNNGGAIYNKGTLTVDHSTLLNNTSEYYGGAVYNEGVVTVRRSLVAGNNAGYKGGAVLNWDGTVTIENSTLAENHTYSPSGEDMIGGAVTNAGSYYTGRIYITNSTLYNNQGGGVSAQQGLYLKNAILSDNSHFDCSGPPPASADHNLVKAAGSAACYLDDGVNGNLVDIDPALKPPAQNGGATMSYAPMPGSPVIDAGDPASCLATDQRDVARPYDSNGDGSAICDIGAIEYNGAPAPATVTVTSAGDAANWDCLGATCTLRDAIPTVAPGGTLVFAPALAGQTIGVSRQFPIEKNVTISGSSQTVSGGGKTSVFVVRRGIVRFDHLVIADGAGAGGGIANRGDLTLDYLTISNNHAVGYEVNGGGIYNTGSLMLNHSTVSGNSSEYYGGAIYNEGTLTVQASTFTGNAAGVKGSAIFNFDGRVGIQNTTMSSNGPAQPTDIAGGVVSNYGDNFAGQIIIQNSTILDNSSGGVYNERGALWLLNSILAYNRIYDCMGAPPAAASRNLIEATGGNACFATDGVDGNLVDIDPALIPLRDNGGATLTYFPMPGSPVIDAGAAGSCPPVDQRDVARPNDSNGDGIPGCDIGAVEYDGPPAPAIVTVTTASDDRDWNCLTGDCALRDAIPTVAPGGTIVFDAALDGKAIRLGAELFIEKDLTVRGNVPVTISGGNAVRVFNARRGNITFDKLAFADGEGAFADCADQFIGPCGGGLNVATRATVTVLGSLFSGNHATFGGGIANWHALIVRDSTFVSNSAGSYGGGGIGNHAAATTEVTNSTFTGNQAGAGGGLRTLELGGVVNVRDSKFAYNVATRGGAIELSTGGTATLVNTEVSGNTASDGGGLAINTAGSLILQATRVVNNVGKARGGGIFNSGGSLTLDDSTISGNVGENADAIGGGIYTFDQTVIENSTIAGNRAWTGGGIYHDGVAPDSLIVRNSTLSGNIASFGGKGKGGGIFTYYNAVQRIENSTLAGNSAAESGGGLLNQGHLTLVNTIIANNGGGDCANQDDAASVDASHNLITAASAACGITNGIDGNIIGVDPQLGPLASNGGPTQTHALLKGSPAIDAGTALLNADQRGVARPFDGNGDGVALADIGSYEYDGPPTQSNLSLYLPLLMNGSQK